MRWLLLLICLGVFGAGGLRAHVVSQLAADFLVDEEGAWELLVFFDAGYAKPEWRGDPDSPQPERAWLVGLSRAEQEELCDEAARYLGECLTFESGGEPVTVAYEFVDFASDPPDFPQVLTGGAYFRVCIKPDEPTTGDLIVRAREAKQPDFAIRLPASGGGAEAFYLSVEPGGWEILMEEGERAAGSPRLLFALKEGFVHVLPEGWDHVLFVLGIFLLVRKGRPLLWQSLAFTVAHTITLGLCAAGFLPTGMGWVEPVIALSIAFLAVENLCWRELRAWRLLLVFAFGLVHGMGFASALASLLQEGEGFLSRLVAANLGVELAQLLILAGCWLLTLGWWEGRIGRGVRLGGNVVLAMTALWWFTERVWL
ncbi:MAG: HupE/UreJ family protein [Verrucomicrobiales bacterium]